MATNVNVENSLPNTALSDIQRLLLANGMAVPPAKWSYPENSVLDPVGYAVNIAAGALAVATAQTSVLAAEQTPLNVQAAQGAYKSKGATNALIGAIYGVGLAIRPSVAATALADTDLVLNAYEVVIKSGGKWRIVPFAECMRIVPGVSASTTVNTTTVLQPTGCPNGGKPQYPFPGRPLLWLGDSDADIGIRCNAALGTTVADIDATLFIWGFLTSGKSTDIVNGTLDRDCDTKTLRGMVEGLNQLAQINRMIR